MIYGIYMFYIVFYFCFNFFIDVNIILIRSVLFLLFLNVLYVKICMFFLFILNYVKM